MKMKNLLLTDQDIDFIVHIGHMAWGAWLQGDDDDVHFVLQGSEDLSGTTKSIAKQNDVDIDLLKKLKKQKKLFSFTDDCMLHIDVPRKVASQIWTDDFFSDMVPDDFDSHAFLQHSWTVFELEDKNLPVLKRDQVANS